MPAVLNPAPHLPTFRQDAPIFTHCIFYARSEHLGFLPHRVELFDEFSHAVSPSALGTGCGFGYFRAVEFRTVRLDDGLRGASHTKDRFKNRAVVVACFRG